MTIKEAQEAALKSHKYNSWDELYLTYDANQIKAVTEKAMLLHSQSKWDEANETLLNELSDSIKHLADVAVVIYEKNYLEFVSNHIMTYPKTQFKYE